MDSLKAIEKRHSTRSYINKAIEGKTLENLRDFIKKCNDDSGLNIQLMLNSDGAFKGLKKSYGLFSGVRNYIALVGVDREDFKEKVGYYGEKIVLEATKMGLSTCWVGGTYSKKDCECEIKKDETLCCVIAIGYGTEKKSTIDRLASKIMHRKTKSVSELCRGQENLPEWAVKGLQAVQKAPSAVNKQPVVFRVKDNRVKASVPDDSYSQVDLGIAKLHFEIGAEGFDWHWA